VALRLPLEISDLFEEWLMAHYPDKARKVFSMIHDIRGGKANDPRFGSRMKGTGPYATLLGDRFKLACKRYGLIHRSGKEQGQVSSALDSTQFAPPPRPGDQLALFEAIRL
jgi:DNA repair photolyase